MVKSKEKPVPFMVRLYKKQRKGITKLANHKPKVSEANIVRFAIDKLLAEANI